MDERKDNKDTVDLNGPMAKRVMSVHIIRVVKEDGTIEDLNKTKTPEEILEFLRNNGCEKLAEDLINKIKNAKEEDYPGPIPLDLDIDIPDDNFLTDDLEDEEDCYLEKDHDSDKENWDEDLDEDEEDTEDEDNDEEYNLSELVPFESEDNEDQERDDSEDLDDWDDDDERCPICGSRDVDELERGSLVGSIAGGAFGVSRKGIAKSLLPGLVSRGVTGIIGGAIGYAAGTVLDKKVLKNRKCAHCGYEWHVDEDLF